jgi:TRIAD3 protein (E3 ubiquitin-protein ligase RNF216)
VEEMISVALLRKCSKCGYPFVKENGCNEIHCVCGMVSPYTCKASSITPWWHFGTGACPHFDISEERKKHERATAEKAAITEVLKKNTEVKEEDLKVKTFNARVKQDGAMRKYEKKGATKWWGVAPEDGGAWCGSRVNGGYCFPDGCGVKCCDGD